MPAVLGPWVAILLKLSVAATCTVEQAVKYSEIQGHLLGALLPQIRSRGSAFLADLQKTGQIHPTYFPPDNFFEGSQFTGEDGVEFGVLYFGNVHHW